MPLISRSRNARNWMHGSQFWSMSKSKPGVNKKGQETLRYAYFNTLASNWLQSWTFLTEKLKKLRYSLEDDFSSR